VTKKFSKPHLSRIINGDIIESRPPEPAVKIRLDNAVAAEYPQYNRSTIQKFIKSGNVTLGRQIVTKPGALIDGSDAVELHLPDVPSLPEIPVVYEDANVLVLDKPAGVLTISKGAASNEPSLDQLAFPAHRLDRATSGIIILAKNEKTRAFLGRQFQQRKVKKTYFAVVDGAPEHPEAIINLPIARSLKAPTTFRVDQKGRAASTHYKTLKSDQKHSLLELNPATGRTHQLRVHLAHIGTPILGDQVYGKSVAARMFLHAAALEITLPGGIRKTFTSDLPREFYDVFK
jgi:23S rRNA pseudouridine1911/1915/1917 synthase